MDRDTRSSSARVKDSSAPFRRPINLSLDAKLVAEARELGLNISRACESGLAAEIVAERRRRWLAENQDALNSSNAFVEEHGLPLATLRLF